MKTLFITGGHGGIGQAIVQEFQARNYKIISPSSRELDLSQVESIKSYFSASVPDIDVLVHSAGINFPKPLEEINGEEFEKTLAVNATSLFYLAQIFLPRLKAKNGGHILAVNSIWGIISKPGRLSYAMSKQALNGLVKTLALELAPHNIKVNSVAPGFVDTKLTRQNNTEEQIKSIVKQVPLGRLAKPEEIARAVYYLCSDDNNYITGQNLVIDGGFTAGIFGN
ncbi:MAG: SDR family NAD(P)-dependent oxidoreductase [Candidatus Doudnabacteria bacterium]|nr:SDR family NAD(P)-dependent oxidoreductase [Candidatus Doudnabacteria bacterium]